MFVVIFSLVLLAACWAVGEQSLRTKLIFSLLFLASFGLCFLPDLPFLFIVAHCLLIAIVGGTTFGPGWLMRRR
jgi:hypothetical protein